MTEYHKQTIIKQKASVTYWNQHPLKPEEYFAQFKALAGTTTCKGVQIITL